MTNPLSLSNNIVVLKKFRGDLQWLRKREGHSGKAYWPGGASGITLDPGLDLGYVSLDLFKEAYKGLLSPTELVSCLDVAGIKGVNAKASLAKASPILRSIRISRDEANKIFPIVAAPYWEDISKRYNSLLDADCPASVQTALLSIAFNRGAFNRRLSVMDDVMAAKDWRGLADIIVKMQQNHKLEGIRKRRRMEADLIYDGVSEDHLASMAS